MSNSISVLLCVYLTSLLKLRSFPIGTLRLLVKFLLATLTPLITDYCLSYLQFILYIVPIHVSISAKLCQDKLTTMLDSSPFSLCFQKHAGQWIQWIFLSHWPLSQHMIPFVCVYFSRYFYAVFEVYCLLLDFKDNFSRLNF